MANCGICEGDFAKEDLTTVTPSKYLGQDYPRTTAFCPKCFVNFARKAKDICSKFEGSKVDKLKKFTRDS